MICIVLTVVPGAQAKSPEALDGEFLEYIAACEHPDDNWTVVADEPLRRKTKTEKKARRPPAKEAKPAEVRP